MGGGTPKGLKGQRSGPEGQGLGTAEHLYIQMVILPLPAIPTKEQVKQHTVGEVGLSATSGKIKVSLSCFQI